MALRLFLLCVILVSSMPVQAQSNTSFAVWLEQFAQEAMMQGVAPTTLQKVLPELEYDESVIELDRKQPESRVSFATYLKNTLPDSRINKASRLIEENGPLLQDIESKTGVPAAIIVALWGVESSFGVNMGDYDVLSSLATLAYEGRRADFFKKELIEAFHILEEENQPASFLRGSWAGAMGQCQFMPSTYRRHAVDYDGNGRRDIWASEPDVLASIANYILAEGWQADLTWGREVKVPKGMEAEKGDGNRKLLSEWAALGVQTLRGNPLPERPLMASLVQPDGAGGRSFLTYENFDVLKRWNRSTYFATAVGLFADQLSRKP